MLLDRYSKIDSKDIENFKRGVEIPQDEVSCSLFKNPNVASGRVRLKSKIPVTLVQKLASFMGAGHLLNSLTFLLYLLYFVFEIDDCQYLFQPLRTKFDS